MMKSNQPSASGSGELRANGLLLQVAMIALITTTLVLAFFGWQRIQVRSQYLSQTLTDSVDANTDWLATALELPLYQFDDVTQNALCNSLLKQHEIIRITVDANDVVANYGDRRAAEIIDTTFSIIKNVSHQGLQIGSVKVVASTVQLQQRIKEYTVSLMLQIIILDIILVCVIVFLLSRKFIAPVKQLQEAANRIARGDLNHPVNIKSDNELGMLTNSLESMRCTIKEKLISLETEIDCRRQTEKELYTAKNYIANVIDSMPSQLIAVDGEHNIVQINHFVEQFYTVSQSEVQGRNLYDVFRCLDVHRAKIKQAIITKEAQFENAYKHDIASVISYEDITIYPLMAKGNMGAVIRIDDVTEHHLMLEELSHNRKMDAIGQLAGGFAHDLNNMLGGIIGSAELLSRRIGEDERNNRYVNLIINSSKRAGELNKKLLTFARKTAIESTPFNVMQAVDDAVAILKHSMDKRIEITVSCATENTAVVGDIAQLQNALINLGVNAGHAMPDGGDLSFIVSNIVLDQRYCAASSFDIIPGEYIDIEVRDSGNGIPADNLRKIFDPFFTTKQQGEGTGLGLAAVYGTMQQHHGEVTVYSELNNGTIFHLYVPIVEQQIDDADQKNDAVFGSGTILVIDDDETIRTTVKDTLQYLGYDVLTAADGQQGVEAFRGNSGNIDLVLLDMIMPVMNGRECFFALRAIDSNVQIVFASGFSREKDIAGLEEHGLGGFIHKPYITAELSKAVAKALRSSSNGIDKC